jgi:hypothetical protein
MTGLMSATSAPDKWMTMSVSISHGGFNCLLTFRPSFKAATFERERAQRLPLRLDQVESRMAQREGLLLSRQRVHML